MCDLSLAFNEAKITVGTRLIAPRPANLALGRLLVGAVLASSGDQVFIGKRGGEIKWRKVLSFSNAWSLNCARFRKLIGGSLNAGRAVFDGLECLERQWTTGVHLPNLSLLFRVHPRTGACVPSGSTDL